MRGAAFLALVLSLAGCIHRDGTLATGPAVVEQAASDPADHPPVSIQVALEEPSRVTMMADWLHLAVPLPLRRTACEH